MPISKIFSDLLGGTDPYDLEQPKPLRRVANDRDAAKSSTLGAVPMMTGKQGEKNYGLDITRPAYDPANDTDPAPNTFMGKKVVPGPYDDPDPTIRVQGRQSQVLDRSNMTEAERMKLYSRVQDQLNSLGPLNMASKRRLASDLLGLQRQLTSDRQGQLASADNQVNSVNNDNANRLQGADTANAGFQDKALDRRASSRAAAAKLAFDNDPNTLQNRLKIADARTKAAQADVSIANAREARSDAQLAARVNAYMKQDDNLSYDDALNQARQAMALDAQRLGRNNANEQAILGEQGLSRAAGQIINDEDSAFRRGFGGGSFMPFAEQRVDPTQVNIQDVQVGRRGGLLGVADRVGEVFGNKAPVEVYVDQNGNKAFGDASALQGQQLEEYIRLKKKNQEQE